MTDAERVKAAQAIKYFKDEWPLTLERFTLAAAMHKAKYDALIKAGFSESQALELCKALF